MLLVAPSGDSYQNVDLESCGDPEGSCHGVQDSSVIIIVDGPDIVHTNILATYVITVIGGPSETYGYFVLIEDPDGVSRDLQGEFLFEVAPNSVTRVGETNTFVIEFTPPRYAVHLKMTVATVSSDNSGDPLGDGWNSVEKEIEVEYPTSVEFPGLDISSNAHLLGTGVLAVGLAMWVAFTLIDRKVKKEVSRAARRRERDN
jgi:hypothetical protein